MGFSQSVKRSFWKGLAALLPALLTVIVLAFGIGLVHKYMGQYVNDAVVQILAWSCGWTYEDAATWYSDHFLDWTGVVVAIMGLCAAAYFVGTFLGAQIIRLLEAWIVRIPVLKRVYPGAKQVSEFFFSERAVEFRRVVAVEFPRKGMWMVGFVTGRGLKAISAHAGNELLSVFIPFSPAPITGYVVAVAREEVVDLDLTVDEAFQYLISAGVIVPQAERIESLKVGFQMSHEDAHALAQSAGHATRKGGVKHPKSKPPKGDSPAPR
jgi:uncharacterized membrane protein